MTQQCSCGNEPMILNVRNSVLGLVVAGCSKCKTSGPARMTAIQAIAEWNKGRRVLVNGRRTEVTGGNCEYQEKEGLN